MASVLSSTELTRALATFDANAERGDYDADGRFRPALDMFLNQVLPFVEPVLDTLSSSLIALSFAQNPFNTYLLTFQGSGIGPVNSLEALQQAIGDGLATGALGNIALTLNGTAILSLVLAPGGYTLTSGVDVYRLTGSMPTTFAQMAELAGLLGQFNTDIIVAMDPSTRAAYFADLSAYGLTGFSVETNGVSFGSFAITATGATLVMGDLTVTLNGTLPDDFGAIAQLFHEVYTEFDALGREIDLTELSGLGVNSLVITDQTGAELLRLDGPVSTAGSITHHTITGTAGNDASNLGDLPFADVRNLTATLLGGNDTLRFNLSDRYDAPYFNRTPITEQGTVTLAGGAGTDTLVLENYLFGSEIAIDFVQSTLFGLDQRSGSRLAFTTAISGFETVTLMGSGYAITGSAASETVRLAGEYWHNNAVLDYSGGAGLDTLDLTGTRLDASAFASFQGVSRDDLTGAYQITRDGLGALLFDADPSLWWMPDFLLQDVEQLILKTATGSEVVSVASLLPASYQTGDTGFFTGTYLSERITGTAAAQEIIGNGGADVLVGEGGNDTLRGGSGADTLNGGLGDDFIFGGPTDGSADLRDLIYGGDGNDNLNGAAGNDELYGGNGNDTVLGDFGADTVVGNDGNDLIGGGAGGDLMFGNAGNDTLNGGFGYDRMNGGTGADSFFHAGVAGHASDWIQDFNAAEGDVLTVGLAGATRAQFQINTTFTAGAGAAGVAEAFIIYRPTGQILWALVDGGDDAVINANIGGTIFDLTEAMI